MSAYIAGIGATSAVMVSLGWAAYEAARPVIVRPAAVGDDVQAGRWRVNVVGARYVPGNPDAVYSRDRQNSLVIDFQVTNLSGATSGSYASLIKLDPPVAGAEQATFLLTRDQSISFDLHPDMPEYVAGYWKWPDGAAPPKEVRLLLAGEIYKRQDNLYGAPGWFPQDPVAVVSVPVEQRRDPE